MLTVRCIAEMDMKLEGLTVGQQQQLRQLAESSETALRTATQKLEAEIMTVNESLR